MIGVCVYYNMFIFTGLQVIWLIILIVITVREGKLLWKQKCDYFSSNWNRLECLHLCCAYGAISLFVAKSVSAVFVIENVKDNFGESILGSGESR